MNKIEAITIVSAMAGAQDEDSIKEMKPHMTMMLGHISSLGEKERAEQVQVLFDAANKTAEQLREAIEVLS